jgi:hypothetical protein
LTSATLEICGSRYVLFIMFFEKEHRHCCVFRVDGVRK